MKNNDGALADLNKALEVDPEYVEGYSARANFKFTMGDYDGSILDLTQIITINRRNKNAFLRRGNAKHRLNRVQAACSDWKQAEGLGSRAALQMLSKYCED